METTTTPTPTPTGAAQRLERPRNSRVVAGVAAGLADHTGTSVGLIRLGFVVTALLGGLGILLYAAAWALLPNEGEPDAPSTRWLDALRTPGHRAGAVVIGVLGLIVLAAAAPMSLIAATLVLLGVALVARPANHHHR